MNYDWDFSVIWGSLPLLLHGLGVSFIVAIAAMGFGSLLGLLVALVRLSKIRGLTSIASIYTEFFRNTPIIAQLLWVYYVLPVMADIRLPALEAAIIAFSLNVGAFMAEIFRAGILSVPRGQREAAIAIGLTPFQGFRRVILPQALQNVLPALANIWLSLLKDTSVASVISITEMMYEARTLAVETYRPVEVFTITGAIYFVVVYLQSVALEQLYAKWLGRSRRNGSFKSPSRRGATIAAKLSK